MRKFARVLSIVLGLVVVPAASAVLAAACSSEPVGVEACRVIEAARCEAMKSCGASESDVTYCIAFYRDQCLHGFANTAAEFSSESTNACVEAIRAVGSCAAAGSMAISECSTVSFVSGADLATKPCDIIKRTPQLLSACVFLATEESTSSGSSSSSSSSSSSGSMGDAGDDASDGG